MLHPRASHLRLCQRCAARTSGIWNEALAKLVCALCWEPLPEQPKKPKRSSGSGASAKRRREDNRKANSFEVSHAGNPLGPGYPSGAPLRRDGESHRDAWKRIIRADGACAYCPGPAGTVDHIDPRSGPKPLFGLHTWCNYAPACASCNRSKGSEKLIVWLARRPIQG